MDHRESVGNFACHNRLMLPRPPDEVPESGGDADRGVGELLLAALTGTALAPFVQAISTKVGQDVYDKIKHLLSRRRNASPTEGKPITLADPATSIVLELPATLDTKDAYGLAAVRLPSSSGAPWLLIRYDPASRTWTAVPVPTPPSDAIQIDNQR